MCLPNIILIGLQLGKFKSYQKNNKKLSYRKETVRMQHEIILAKYNWKTIFCRHWRDALKTVINSRKLSDALGNPSTQRKHYYNPIWQITLHITDKNNTTHF